MIYRITEQIRFAMLVIAMFKCFSLNYRIFKAIRILNVYFGFSFWKKNSYSTKRFLLIYKIHYYIIQRFGCKAYKFYSTHRINFYIHVNMYRKEFLLMYISYQLKSWRIYILKMDKSFSVCIYHHWNTNMNFLLKI